MELGKGQSLIAVALIALGVAAAESPSDAQQATSSMPSGVLTYLTYTARFASDGRFEIDGTIEGMGRFRFDGNWSRTGDRLDLRGSLDAAGAKLFAMTGMPPEAMMCPTPEPTALVSTALTSPSRSSRMPADRAAWCSIAPAGVPPARRSGLLLGTSSRPRRRLGLAFQLRLLTLARGHRFAAAKRVASPTASNYRISGTSTANRTCSGERRFPAWRTQVRSSGATAAAGDRQRLQRVAGRGRRQAVSVQ
jgi:hypothetical protein